MNKRVYLLTFIFLELFLVGCHSKTFALAENVPSVNITTPARAPELPLVNPLNNAEVFARIGNLGGFS